MLENSVVSGRKVRNINNSVIQMDYNNGKPKYIIPIIDTIIIIIIIILYYYYYTLYIYCIIIIIETF